MTGDRWAIKTREGFLEYSPGPVVLFHAEVDAKEFVRAAGVRGEVVSVQYSVKIEETAPVIRSKWAWFKDFWK